MKIIYLGSPEFALAPLKQIVESGHEVVLVVTKPDAQKGRGGKVEFNEIKKYAISQNIPVFQPEKIRLPKNVEILKNYNADVMVVYAFGQIFNKAVIDVAPHGMLNIHPSLLPKYRGAAPVQAALISGEKVTGVTIIKIAEGIANGEMLLQEKVEILPEDTVISLTAKLSTLGANIMLKALKQVADGTAVYTSQDEEQMSYFKMFKKEDGKIDFNKTAEEISNFVRGIQPWPGAFIKLSEGTFKVFSAKPSQLKNEEFLANGTIIVASPKQGLHIICESGVVEIETIQSEGGKVMPAKAYLNGKKIEVKKVVD